LVTWIILTVINWCFDCKIKCEKGQPYCWVTGKAELAKAYFTRMFLVDAFSVIPFDVIAANQDKTELGDLKVLRVLKLFRLLKMLRIFRGLRIVKRYETDYAIDYQALNISSLLICLLTTAHWIACLLAMICKYDNTSPTLEDFFPDMAPLAEKPSSLKNYFYCFTWGLAWWGCTRCFKFTRSLKGAWFQPLNI
jgi:hypothetical protein